MRVLVVIATPCSRRTCANAACSLQGSRGSEFRSVASAAGVRNKTALICVNAVRTCGSSTPPNMRVIKFAGARSYFCLVCLFGSTLACNSATDCGISYIGGAAPHSKPLRTAPEASGTTVLPCRQTQCSRLTVTRSIRQSPPGKAHPSMNTFITRPRSGHWQHPLQLRQVGLNRYMTLS